MLAIGDRNLEPVTSALAMVGVALVVVFFGMTLSGCEELLDVLSDSPESECCVDNFGCPTETGYECPGDCCCCPEGMRCDQQTPSNGCVNVTSSGGSGGGSNGSTCGGAGDNCNTTACCSGYECVNDAAGDGVSRCAFACNSSSQCESNCCCDLEGPGGACCGLTDVTCL